MGHGQRRENAVKQYIAGRGITDSVRAKAALCAARAPGPTPRGHDVPYVDEGEYCRNGASGISVELAALIATPRQCEDGAPLGYHS
jgi:hypothetical protein